MINLSVPESILNLPETFIFYISMGHSEFLKAKSSVEIGVSQEQAYDFSRQGH